MTAVRPYIVRQGDYVAKVASQVGCAADVIWGQEKNQELAEQGRSMELLAPGDVLYVPERGSTKPSIRLGEQNSFSAQVPRVELTIVLVRDGEPLRGEPYVIVGVTPPLEGRTDGEGLVRIRVPVTATELKLVMIERGEVQPLNVGWLDPVVESSGMASRLKNLGYLSPWRELLDASGSPSWPGAMARFQEDRGLGQDASDEDAHRLLREAHGS